MADERVIAWLETPERAPVVDSEGNDIGVTEAVLGDDENGIFHGLAVNLKGLTSGTVEIPADRVDRITTERVYTSVGPGEVDDLPEYEENRWFDFKGVGRLLRRPRWEKDE